LAQLSKLCNKEVLTPTINHGDCDFVNKVFQSFTSNGAKEYNKLVLQTMIQKMCHDKMKTKLSPEEEKECNELADVFLEQMKLNASKIVGKEGSIRFSPKFYGLHCPSTPVHRLDTMNSRSLLWKYSLHHVRYST